MIDKVCFYIYANFGIIKYDFCSIYFNNSLGILGSWDEE